MLYKGPRLHRYSFIPHLNSLHVLSNRNEEIKIHKEGVFPNLKNHQGKGEGSPRPRRLAPPQHTPLAFPSAC